MGIKISAARAYQEQEEAKKRSKIEIEKNSTESALRG
jgi:hypothetical protein